MVVCVKQVGILGEDVEFVPDGTDIDPDFLDHVVNEWDMHAIEEALRIREARGSGEVLAVSVGGRDAETCLRRSLATGVDRAVRVESAAADPFSVARALAYVIEREAPDLILCGAQSSDSVQAATGGALAGLLGYPCVAVVTSLELSSDGRGMTVQRELEGGLREIVDVDLPAVVTIQTGINDPRYATMRAVREAAQRDIEVAVAPLEGKPAYRVLRMYTPPRRAGAQVIEGSPSEIASKIAAIVSERLT
jgi:electron transfer flavoprotein beta subunit